MNYQSKKEKINLFFNQPNNFWAYLVQTFLIILILLSVADFIIEYAYASYYLANHFLFKQAELGIVSIFIIEYALRLWAAPDRKKFIISFYGIIDILSIIPTFFTVINLLPLRTLRLLRLLRMTRLLRVSKLFRYFQKNNETNPLNISRIVQENILKNLVVVVGLFMIYEEVKKFIYAVPKDVIGDVMFANSILALAAMFGFFAYSYKDVNPQQVISRAISHITTAALLFPIGLMFILIQLILSIEIGHTPFLVVLSIWMVYTSVLLWDFANVLKVKEFIDTPKNNVVEKME